MTTSRRVVLTLPLAGAVALSGYLAWTGLPHSSGASSASLTAPSATSATHAPSSSPSASRSESPTPQGSPTGSPKPAAEKPATEKPATEKPTAATTKASSSSDPARDGGRTRLWQPARLVVPALHVDAPVVPIAAQGSVLTPPSDPQVIGWWNATARVGEQGSIVLTGHTVHTGGGALDHLKRVRPGDVVRLAASGHGQGYRVTSVRDYSKAGFARNAGSIFAQDVSARLVVITCDDYDRWSGTYLSNTVVVATPI